MSPFHFFVFVTMCRRAIRTAFKNHQRGAILTTHYMEEAEAVCDRVAIMVSGQLRFVLSILLISHIPILQDTTR